MKTTLKLDKITAQNIIWGDDEDFKEVLNEIVDNSRWAIQYRYVGRRISDGKYFQVYYQRGATESQDEQPFEYDEEVEFTEVFPVEKKVIVYE